MQSIKLDYNSNLFIFYSLKTSNQQVIHRYTECVNIVYYDTRLCANLINRLARHAK